MPFDCYVCVKCLMLLLLEVVFISFYIVTVHLNI